jgi:hypothetical protein
MVMKAIANPGNNMSQLEIDVDDQMTPYLRGIATNNPTWMRKATKSLGWWMQSEIKKGIRSGAPAGAAYEKTVPSLRRLLEKKKRFPLLGKLVNAVGYQYNNGNLLVGWLSRNAVFLGSIQEKGKRINVTDRMRRWFFAKGSGVGDGIVDIPARPTFGPMFKFLEPKAVPYMEAKMIEYWQNPPQQSSARRRYKVKG